MHHALRRLKFRLPTVLTGCVSVPRTMTTASRTYADAVDALNSLQTPFHVLEARRKAGIRLDAETHREMRAYLARIGHSITDLDRLNIVHVAGTKGKGSTCAFVDSILRNYRLARGRPAKTGLLISPHLIAVRERIRIDSAPISEALFARYFFDVWDRLGGDEASTATVSSDATVLDGAEPGSRPAYARYLTLLSYHVFLEEGVDVAVYETGIGGEFDSTNVVERPVASGISTLGIDHVVTLGNTIEEIAWHKAGIMKTGSRAFTVEQDPRAIEALRNRADEKNVSLTVLGLDPRLKGVKIRPNALFQKKNASLAVALAETVLARVDASFTPDETHLPREFVDGLEHVVWRGRCEVLPQGKITWHVDGAHTADSLKMASRWFAEESAQITGPRALIFNQQGRSEALSFLDAIFAATKSPDGRSFDHVIFCTNVTYADTGYKRDFVNKQYDPSAVASMTAQKAFAQKWSELDPAAKVEVIPTIEEAINRVRGLGEGLGGDEFVTAFITGSLHLVGGALGMLEKVDAL